MKHENLEIKTTLLDGTRLTSMVDFPLNQEVQVKIVKYVCDGCPEKYKIFLDGVEKVSQTITTKIWQNLSCYVPWLNAAKHHEVTELKYISNVPLFGKNNFETKSLKTCTVESP